MSNEGCTLIPAFRGRQFLCVHTSLFCIDAVKINKKIGAVKINKKIGVALVKGLRHL